RQARRTGRAAWLLCWASLQRDAGRAGNAHAELLIAYPWTLRVFTNSEGIVSATAVSGYAMEPVHSRKVLTTFADTSGDLAHIEEPSPELSEWHMDQSFRLLGNTLIGHLADHLRNHFIPTHHSAYQASQYH
uniref:Uncharacterized protein n=1 Tax=Varanus komodoensis TaxID=61221 RepID=A0A8D2LCB2_VARKO